ncbi:hypothetical protein [Natrinema versiforme]|uniref:PGF-CTERM sorting domain-containing protein n=1 Tax=Natrinema versiforme TaxID=88724 RepID=A0A4P8WJB8_9EURY|nr:hypothetical protein [Natrinema versiforme]QCS43559.1 hypothetical protein FEJ81_14820 [Natrinema versiforme]
MPSDSTDSRRQSTDASRAFLALLLVAAVGIASMGLPVVYGGMTTTAEATDTADVESYETISQAESELDPADEVYLRDDGSAVLRYDDEDSDINQFKLGMNASEGLVHMLVVDDIEDDDSVEDIEEANFSAILDQQGFSGDGSLVMQQPEDIKDLSVDVSGEVSDETNEFDATATGTFESDATSTGAVSTSGYVTATTDRLETAGSVSVDDPMASSDTGTYMDVSLQDTSDGYTVDVSRERNLADFQSGDWETREQAKQTLQRQYGDLATRLGGTSTIEITNYNYEERSTGEDRLEIDFTVEYTGIDDGIEEQLTDTLANDQSMDLSRSEAEEIATSVTDLEIETAEFTMSESDGSIDIEWEFALANYDELSLAMLDLAESAEMNDALNQSDIEDARTSLEAQQAADLTWELEWDATVEQTSNDELQLDAELTSDTENWVAYIDELESRGVETPNDVTFSLTAETDGDELAVDGQFDVEAQDLASQALESMAQSAQSGPTTSSSSEADQFVSTLADSELEVARVDASLTDDTVRVEGGAKFDNMSKVADSLSSTVGIGGIATETTDGNTSMYVHVDDMGDVDTESATKSDIEHLGVVDSETTVRQAGDWDEEFPEPDTTEMRNYLGLSAESGETTEEEESESIPGFGAGVGLAAIAGLLTALVLRQRT